MEVCVGEGGGVEKKRNRHENIYPRHHAEKDRLRGREEWINKHRC